MQVLVDGAIPVHVEVTGSGPALLLLSSAASTEWWAEQVGPWSEHFTVVNWDYRRPSGYAAPPVPCDSVAMASHAVQLLDHLGFAVAHVNGVSGGARAACFLASRWGDRLDRLVLTTPSPPVVGKAVEALIADPDSPRIFTDPSYAQTLRPEELADEMARLVFSESFYAAHPERCLRLLAQPPGTAVRSPQPDEPDVEGDLVKAPTLVVVGEADRTALPQYGYDMHDAIAGSELVAIPGGTHGMLVEDTTRYGRLVASFLSA